jgi:hypothetical protein
MRAERLRQSLTAAAIAVAVTPALVGCGGGDATGPASRPVPGCEAFDHAPCDVRVTSCQTRLFALAGCLRGEVPSAPPPITVLSEADFAAVLTLEAAMETPSPHLATWDWALSSLKLIEPGGLSTQTTLSESVKFIWGRYRSGASKDIQIIDHGADFDARSASPVLIHEMIHALQDREVDLAQLHATFETTPDSRLAVRSITEGEARLHETRYRASALGLDPAQVDWTRRFENAVDRDEQQLPKEPSPLTATSRAFPYEWGAHYVYNRWVAGGMSGVHGLFVAPPLTTRVLMASADVDVDVDPEPAPERPDQPTPPPGWTVVGGDVLGGWALFLVLTKSTPDVATAAIEELALAWRSDGIGIFEGPAGATAVVWRIDLGDPGVATQVAALLAGLSNVTVSLVGTSITLAIASDAGPLDWAFAHSP